MPISEETRKKLCKARKGKKPNLGKRWKLKHKKVFSTEHKKKLKKARIGRSPALGKHWKLSDETRENMRKASKRGKDHYNWKGGIKPLTKVIRACFEYRQWRSDIFTRDNFTCIICGDSTGGNLQADHFPKMFSEILKEFKIISIEQALACEKLWDINNGRTLCRNCHMKYGRKVGKKVYLSS